MRRFPAAYRLRAWQFHFSPELIRLVTTGLERRTRSPRKLRWGKLASWDLRCAGTRPRHPRSLRFRRGRIFRGEDRNANVDCRARAPRMSRSQVEVFRDHPDRREYRKSSGKDCGEGMSLAGLRLQD